MKKETIGLNGQTVLDYKINDTWPNTAVTETEMRCFIENAWFFYANLDRIGSDSVLSLARVPIKSYIITLGAMLEYWDKGERSIHRNDDGSLALVYHVTGNPMTGSCCVRVIVEDGTTSCIRSSDMRVRYKAVLKACKSHAVVNNDARALTIVQVRNQLLSEQDSAKTSENATTVDRLRLQLKYMQEQLEVRDRRTEALQQQLRETKAYVARLKREEIMMFYDRHLKFEAAKEVKLEALRCMLKGRKPELKRMGDKELQRTCQWLKQEKKRVKVSRLDDGWQDIWPWQEDGVEDVVALMQCQSKLK